MYTSQRRRLIDRSIIEFAEGLPRLRQASAAIGLAADRLGYIAGGDADGVAVTEAMAPSCDVMIENGAYPAIIRTSKIPEAAELKDAFAN